MIPTEAGTGAEAVIRRIGEAVVGLLDREKIPMNQCIGAGVGVPGQGEVLLAPIREMVKTGCFGGAYGELPEIRTAELGNRAGMIGAANLV
ncbi:MAG: hypothetical protein SOW08_04185 [Lachnospiraceae bacterium]|nr:hypothetical protein [Lachnospiraceae bacterium]